MLVVCIARWQKGLYSLSLSFPGLTAPAVSLVLCGYLGSTVPLAIFFLTMGVGFNGLTYGGFKVNQLDIAASKAGALMGITNTFATVPGIVSPQITKLIAKTVSSCDVLYGMSFVAKCTTPGRTKYMCIVKNVCVLRKNLLIKSIV